MALFEDRSKPVNIYAKGTATAKAQETTSDMALSPAKTSLNVLDKATTPAQSIIKSATQPVRNAMANQDAALGRQRLRSSILKTPQSDPASFRQVESPVKRPDISTFRQNEGPTNVITGTPAAQRANMTGERVVGGNMPGYKPQFGPAAQPDVRNSIIQKPQVPMQTVYQNDGNRVYSTQQPVRERIMQPQPMQQPRVPGGMTDSGLSIQFTKNVPNAVRQQVMQPSNINDPAAQSRRGQAQEQWYARNGYEKVDPNTGLTSSDMLKMRPMDRAKVMDAVAGRNNERAKVDIDRTLAAGNLEIGRGKLGVEQGQLGINQRQADMQGKIADSQIAELGIAMDAAQAEQARIAAGESLRRQLSGTTNDKERLAIRRVLVDRGYAKEPENKFEFKTVKQPQNVDGTGGGETGMIFDERTGMIKPVEIPGQRKTARPDDHKYFDMIERLKRDFEKKFGYLPEGV